MTLDEILDAVKKLTKDDLEKLQESLSVAKTDAEAADDAADEKVKEKAGDVISDIEEDQTAGRPDDDVKKDEEELKKAVDEDENTDEAVKAEQKLPAPPAESEPDDEPILPITAGGKPAPDPQDISGEDADAAAEPPADYQEIIDGLNAKNMALEAEIKQLKAKVEGAFGLTGKPAGFGKVNPLFDDDLSDIPHMRKNY